MVASTSALEGLGRAQTAFDQAASEIANPSSTAQDVQDQVSLSDAAVAMMQASTDYQANLKSLQVANDMQKSLLNILA